MADRKHDVLVTAFENHLGHVGEMLRLPFVDPRRWKLTFVRVNALYNSGCGSAFSTLNGSSAFCGKPAETGNRPTKNVSQTQHAPQPELQSRRLSATDAPPRKLHESFSDAIPRRPSNP
jgi:hypothetical protein